MNILERAIRRQDMKRLFGESNNYHLNDLIYTMQERLSQLDPSSEEYKLLFADLLVLDNRKSAYDEDVRQYEIRSSECIARFEEIEARKSQIEYAYRLEQSRIDAEREEARMRLEASRQRDSKISALGWAGIGIMGGLLLGAVGSAMGCSDYSSYLEDYGPDYDCDF